MAALPPPERQNEDSGNGRGVWDVTSALDINKSRECSGFIAQNTKAIERFNRHEQRMRCCIDKHTMMFTSCAYKLQCNNSTLRTCRFTFFFCQPPPPFPKRSIAFIKVPL